MNLYRIDTWLHRVDETSFTQVIDGLLCNAKGKPISDQRSRISRERSNAKHIAIISDEAQARAKSYDDAADALLPEIAALEAKRDALLKARRNLLTKADNERRRGFVRWLVESVGEWTSKSRQYGLKIRDEEGDD